MPDKDPDTRSPIDIERVPLLLAYPTALLASSLIIPQHTQSFTTLVLSLVLVPMFLASGITVAYAQMRKSTTKRKEWMGQRTLITLFALFVATQCLGTIRTVVLSLVLVINVNWPFVVGSFIFDIAVRHSKEQLALVPQSIDESGLYATILGYSLLYAVKSGLREIDQVQGIDSLMIPLVAMTLSGLGLSYQFTEVHASMILVTIASAVVLNFAHVDPQGVSFRKGSPTVVGFIAVLLEILSFSSNFMDHKLVAAGEVVLVFSTAFIEVDEDLFERRNVAVKADEPQELSIIQQLFLHDDTKAIFSYLMLNTIFMFVQFLYSFRSKSLGLLSDSLHMALDCTSLALGLVAGVLAKRPPSDAFPFGLARIETLAGFANGVLLVGIVAGIFMEAIERMINPVTLEKTGELLVVSFLGFLVNIIGIFAFNHGHAHGHSHGGSHSHSHGGDSSSGMSDNENMKGIFLHILADTLGSAGVVVSTILTSMFHSNIFDPLASLFIAVMIFISAIPLIKSSAANLLLSLDGKKEEIVRDILSQISTTPGVTGYTTPRFWVSNDMKASITEADHGHSHSVEVQPSHSHSHSNSNSHSHSHSNSHSHKEHQHEDSSSQCTEATTPELVGYIHIQYIDGENSTIIKKRVQKIFENHNTRVMIQVESESSRCWCRKTT